MKNGVRKMVFKLLGNRSRQITQVEQYAYTISDDERFRHPNTRWSFWVISNDIDAFAKIKS